MDCCLSPPCVPIRASRIGVIKILSSIGLLLPAWWPLPLLKLLEWYAINVVHRYNWISVNCLSDEILQLILDFGLLLLQVLGLERWLFVR